MLKKSSAPVFSSSVRLPSSSAMEVEGTRVHVLADGKKLIDVTLRWSEKQTGKNALVIPQFEDESDESSSSGSEDGNSAHRGAPVYTSPGRRPQSSCSHQLDAGSEDNNNVPDQQSAQSEFKWNVSSANDIQQLTNANDIQQLTNANAQLVLQATDFKRQIKSYEAIHKFALVCAVILQIQLEALAPVPGLHADLVNDILQEREGRPEHDIRDAKIVHQAKILRHLKRSLQREKQLAVDAVRQCKLLETSTQQLERENETLRLKAARFQARATAAASASALAQQEAPELGAPPPATGGASGEANQQLKKKLEDLKTKHDKLQLDFKKLHRALQREVGDDVPLDEILEGPPDGANGGKRGRAQQIVMLKAKIKKLEAEFAKTSHLGPSSSHASEPGPLSNNVDARAQHELAGQQTQKQRLVDKLTLERDEALEKLVQTTKKYDAVKSRSQTLEKDKHESKARFQLLVDKSKNDDALVDALQRQLETWKTKVQEVKRVRTAESVGSQKDDRLAELERLRGVVAEYKRHGGVLPAASSQASQSSTLSIATSMPVTSEASQFRAMAAEKERLQEVVRALQIQLDENERQLHQARQQQPPKMPTEDASLVSRIPRKPGVPALGGRSGFTSSGINQSTGDSMHGAEVEALRRTFRESLRAKEDEIAALMSRLHDLQETQQHQQRSHEISSTADDSGSSAASDDLAQEVQDLQEENQFLRQEFEKLKTRYEAIVRSANASSKTK